MTVINPDAKLKVVYETEVDKEKIALIKRLDNGVFFLFRENKDDFGNVYWGEVDYDDNGIFEIVCEMVEKLVEGQTNG